MAYPSVAAPYGLIPINLIGGQVFAGSTRNFPINSASATAIFFGDIVKLNNDGTVGKDTGTSAATPVGVFLGCSYTDPTFGKTFRQFYPGAVTAADIVATVVDDPDTLFKVAVVSSGTTISYVNRVAVSSTTATTSTWPVRIVDVIAETTSAAGSFTEVVVKWNQGMHPYLNPTGV
jgi:hypothetical protein